MNVGAQGLRTAPTNSPHQLLFLASSPVSPTTHLLLTVRWEVIRLRRVVTMWERGRWEGGGGGGGGGGD